MTDKIMIRDIDVSKCRYFCKYNSICRSENISRFIRPMCKDVKNCYYKQLKRKEQALDEIEKLANTLITATNEYGDCYHKDRCNKCKEREECQYYQTEAILTIVNKVKDGE